MLSELPGHAAVDAVALLLLVGGLYARRHAGRELLMVYTCFNVGLFAALVAITSGDFPAGVGFGLFGVLSIIRLRSQTFSPGEVGYFFVALVLALVNGLPERGLLLPAALSGALLVAVFLADHPALHPPVATARVVLDRAYRDDDLLRAAVAERLGAQIVDVQLLEVDDVRETTQVAVRYLRPDGTAPADLVLPREGERR
ncbi:MAG: hypothetical protein JWO60_159 [Frankiales bacterium]|nr:hypothetical protein [Frankiales bacterium]